MPSFYVKYTFTCKFMQIPPHVFKVYHLIPFKHIVAFHCLPESRFIYLLIYRRKP